MYISVYNLFYTSLPVLALGIFEQDVSDKHSIEYPKLYAPGINNALFNTTEFIRSVLHGVFSSLVLFLIPYGKFKLNLVFKITFLEYYREFKIDILKVLIKMVCHQKDIFLVII